VLQQPFLMLYVGVCWYCVCQVYFNLHVAAPGEVEEQVVQEAWDAALEYHAPH
jgi:hypothetical protein